MRRVTTVKYQPPRQGFSHSSFEASERDESDDTTVMAIFDHFNRKHVLNARKDHDRPDQIGIIRFGSWRPMELNMWHF